MMGAREPIIEDHLERVRDAAFEVYTPDMVPAFIVRHTKLQGAKFSFKDHEFQERILSDTSQEVIIKKCSQVGISEASARMSLALTNMFTAYTVIYTVPTADFAVTFMKTRIDPVIDGSARLSGNIHKSTDNTQVKRFGDSYLYMRGASSDNAPISIPADHLVHDELDFSDQKIISQYHSRLTHSKHKRKTKLSTPTLPGYGIDGEFQSSRRHFNMVKCSCCGHWFFPNYHKHVRIPNFPYESMREITKRNLFQIRYMEAYVECPSCKGKPSLQVEHREWVCENPDENFIAAGYQVSPFDAPNIILLPELIKASTDYERWQDFDNFNLGMAAEDKDATLTEEDFAELFTHAEASEHALARVMGLDLGVWCHCLIGDVDYEGNIFVIYSEVIHYSKLQVRRRELQEEFHVSLTVCDFYPYSETVLAMQQEDTNLYAAIYVKSKSTKTHNVRGETEEGDEKEKQQDEGQALERVVNINRNLAFDEYMRFVRKGSLMFKETENKRTIIDHHLDMKRTKEFDASREMAFVWRKSAKGEDHFHHAGLYLFIAAKMRGRARSSLLLPLGMVRRFKRK